VYVWMDHSLRGPTCRVGAAHSTLGHERDLPLREAAGPERWKRACKDDASLFSASTWSRQGGVSASPRRSVSRRPIQSSCEGNIARMRVTLRLLLSLVAATAAQLGAQRRARLPSPPQGSRFPEARLRERVTHGPSNADIAHGAW